ncbi:hypothetical protein HDU97_003298 [Phlyctochytrium planicorne]|nr:hypothetical protein HDU97_003298 [Phlyctochytrium planicorne]
MKDLPTGVEGEAMRGEEYLEQLRLLERPDVLHGKQSSHSSARNRKLGKTSTARNKTPSLYSGNDADLDSLGDSSSSFYTAEQFRRDGAAWLKSMSLFIGFIVVYLARWYFFAPAMTTVKRGFSIAPPVLVGKEREEWLRARNQALDTELVREPLKIYLIWTTVPETFTLRNYKVIDSYLYHHPDAEIEILASHLSSSAFSAYTDAGYRVNIIRSNDTFLADLASRGCPGSSWIHGPQAERWKQGKYYYSHVTDYIRFCVLYAYGGMYSDFDALTLNRMDGLGRTFIGKDSAGVKREVKLGEGYYPTEAEQLKMGRCDWCLRDGDTYLAPGVMAATKGHPLVHRALEIGFGGRDYNPEVFNAVGPMAVTKAFVALGGDRTGGSEDIGVNVLDRHVLYPYNYKTSWEAFESDIDGEVKARQLQRRSASLHLYGHKTKHLDIGVGSIVNHVMQKVSVVDLEGISLGRTWHDLRGPRFLSVKRFIEEVADLRILSRRRGVTSGVLIKVQHGSIRVASNNGNGGSSWASKIVIPPNTPAALNRALSRLVYFADNLPHGRDEITVNLFESKADEDEENAPSLKIPVYDVNSLVTIMVKTMDRIGKVFVLVESARKHYPNITIIASDDGKNVAPEGHKRGFYYLPLKYDVGLSAGRNRMVERVQTEYVLTLDDDFKLDEDSAIEELIHALETPDGDGKTFDIAAAKNPDDEDRFELDFCGLMKITPNRILSLGPGSYGKHGSCYHVDFVPNIFVARTSLLRERLRWDELLKLGEHEDFFLRAKKLGVRTLTCPGVSFHHEQVQHWLMKTEYDRMRNRVYDFWRLSLRKHNLVRLVSFGRTMMDIIVPDPVRELKSTEILARTATLSWVSDALSFRVLVSKNEGYSWEPVNFGQGENYQPVPIIASDNQEGQRRQKDSINSLVIMSLVPGTEYRFRVHAGNRFDYEEAGVEINVKTLSSREEDDLNMIQNPSFELEFKGYQVFNKSATKTASPGASGDFAAQIDITTLGYLSQKPVLSGVSQHIQGSVVHAMISKQKTRKLTKGHTLTLSLQSKLGKFYDQYPSWRMEFSVWYELHQHRSRKICRNDAFHWPMLARKPDAFIWEEYDRSNPEWQSRVASVCFGKEVEVALVVAAGNIESYRGFVVFDNFVLVADRAK